ncbi:MAG: phytanoyl-CoA dioxygenase, partial [Candidatus Latescibacterota bacterium]|nr:phytanoyl-CoA dioxygenase [Candidatus Latescibacterota bacterium]
LGSLAAGAVSQVASVLDDENRYNRFYATLALRRIGTPEAQDRLIDALIVSRWCPITSKDDLF